MSATSSMREFLDAVTPDAHDSTDVDLEVEDVATRYGHELDARGDAGS